MHLWRISTKISGTYVGLKDSITRIESTLLTVHGRHVNVPQTPPAAYSPIEQTPPPSPPNPQAAQKNYEAHRMMEAAREQQKKFNQQQNNIPPTPPVQ